MADYTIHIDTGPDWTVYAIVIKGKEVGRQMVRFAPDLNTPENALSIALSDILVRIERVGKNEVNWQTLPDKQANAIWYQLLDGHSPERAKKYSISIPDLLHDDIVYEKVCLFGGCEVRME